MPELWLAELAQDTRDVLFTYKGEATSIAEVTGDFCPVCSEGVFGAETSGRVGAEMKALAK